MSLRLAPVPSTLVATRTALHALAEHVVAPARTQATGNEIALEPCPGGFGTPRFPDGGSVAALGNQLQVITADRTTTLHPLTSLQAAGRAAGLQDVEALALDPLAVDPSAAHLIATLFAFANEALGVLRGEAAPAGAPSAVHLWPEHFDLAYEEGDEAAGQRAGYGVSPGDAEHPEPYAYVGPWTAPPAGPLWNADAFPGAELGYAELHAAADPLAAVLAFFRTRRDALQQPPTIA